MNTMLFRKKIILASPHDQLHLENGPLNDLIYYVDRDEQCSYIIKDIFPILAIVVSSQGAADIKKFLQAVRANRTIPDVTTVTLDPDTADGTGELIRQILQGSLTRLAAFTSAFGGELAMLRRERELLLENYRALEDAFCARNWEPATEVFAHDPFIDPKEEGIGQILREAGVEQLLPISSHGVSGFALHFHTQSDHGGELFVKLDYVEDDECVAEWSVPFFSIKKNWNYFTLPKGCDRGHRTLRLRISADGGKPPELSLGHPISNRRYAARTRVPHGDLAHRPLAFRVFAGLPGVRPAAMANMLSPNAIDHGRRVVDQRLPTEILRGVTDVSITPIVADFQTVYFAENEGAIICHPLVEGISAAAINSAVSSGTVRFSARARIDHPEGQPAAVGLLLAPPAADLRAEVAKLDADGGPPSPPLFSGWRQVTPEQPININVLFDAALSKPMDLIVVSRAVHASVDFCWLKVFDLRMVRECGAAA